MFLTRIVPTWGSPSVLPTENWRQLIRNQPVAMICRDTIISNILSVPWRIVSKNPDINPTDEIDYYTNLIETEDGGYEVHTDLILQDALDTPFGGICEDGREDDSPTGRVLWFKRIDAATMMPTYNDDWPVAQVGFTPIPTIFPEHAIDRLYYTPRTEFRRKGWGMAPPERIYLALELMFRGDRYYANLLLDTPEVGILDLGDMAEHTATSWLGSWRALLTGNESFKVPVLYEHTTPAKWIPFTRSPVELAYDKTTLRYMQVVAAGYGLSLSDIGVIEGDAGTLAGQIRSERRSARTGIGVARRKITRYWNKKLPPYLKFEIIDRDDEVLVAKGRARLANSMALNNLTGNKPIIPPEVARDQLVSDGLLTVPVYPPPEELMATQGTGTNAGQASTPRHVVANYMQKPVPASSGGMGEVIAAKSLVLNSLTPLKVERMRYLVRQCIGSQVDAARTALPPDEFMVWQDEYDRFVKGEETEFSSLELVAKALSEANKRLDTFFSREGFNKVLAIPSGFIQSITDETVSEIRDAYYIIGSALKEESLGVLATLSDELEPEIVQLLDLANERIRDVVSYRVIRSIFTGGEFQAPESEVTLIVDDAFHAVRSLVASSVVAKLTDNRKSAEQLASQNSEGD